VMPGGSWISTNANASVSGGVVTGESNGTDTIYYTVTNSCGTDTANYSITINSLPNAGSITGATTVCTGSNITLTDVMSGGSWISSNANATVSGGVVTGESNGTDTIYYTVSNSCGTDTATYSITINSLPGAGSITGATTICVGSNITLTDVVSGGSWISSNANASVSGGVVTGESNGTD